MRLIKKYANRKFYDTEDKRYVSLEGIASLVRAGEVVRVVDNESGAEITTVVLSQILREQETKGSSVPEALLAALIQRGSGGLRQVRESFHASLKALEVFEGDVRDHIDALVQHGEISLTEAQELREELLARARDRQASLEEKMLQDVKASLIRLGMPTRSDLEGVSSRLGEVEAKVDSLLRDRA